MCVGDYSNISLSDFPMDVRVENVKKNNASIVLINKRPLALHFKCFLSDPNSVVLKPAFGSISGMIFYSFSTCIIDRNVS